MLVFFVLFWLFLAALWSPAGKELTSWLSCVLCFLVLYSFFIFTDRSKAVPFCGSFVLFMSCVCHAFTSVHCDLVVTCWERADLWLLFVKSNCDFVTFRWGILGQGVVLDCIVS